MKTKDLKKALRKKKKEEKLSFLSTGSTLLNLACTGKPYCGFAKGRYYFIVGDSASGKTFLSLTCLAEASINSNFDNYRFIYDNSEGGAMMDIKRFFGKRVWKRMEAPSSNKGEDVFSSTIEEFYYHIDDALHYGKPFIYILDSMDSLSSQSEADKFEEHKTAYRKGKSAAGSYTDGKAKINSANLRRIISSLKKEGQSILIIINQTRDNIGFGFERKSRSGGHALRFYATIELWSSVRRRVSKTVKGKKRQLGIECLIEIKKNRITGRERKLTIPIYHSFGIDDIGSCINYLTEEGHWKTQGNKIIVPEFEFRGSKERLIRYVDEYEMERDLRDMVGDVWNEIEESCRVKRKRRYE